MQSATETKTVNGRQRVARRLSPTISAAAAIAVGLLVRQSLVASGLAESRDVFDLIRAAGVMALAGAVSWWAAKLSRQLLVGVALGVLAGMAAGSFAHEPIPALAGLIILGYLAVRFSFALLRWVSAYVFAVVYGGGLGVGAHYLIYEHDSVWRYGQAGLLLVGGLGLVYMFLRSASDDLETSNPGRMQLAFNRMHRSSLLGVVALSLAGSLYMLQGQNLTLIVNQWRQPLEEEVEQRVEDWKTANERIDAAKKFKDGVEKFLTEPKSD